MESSSGTCEDRTLQEGCIPSGHVSLRSEQTFPCSDSKELFQRSRINRIVFLLVIAKTADILCTAGEAEGIHGSSRDVLCSVRPVRDVLLLMMLL